MNTLHPLTNATFGPHCKRVAVLATSLGFVLPFALVSAAGLYLSLIRDGLQPTIVRATMALGAVVVACILWRTYRFSSAVRRSFEIVLLADAVTLFGLLPLEWWGIDVSPAAWATLFLGLDAALVSVVCGSMRSALFEIHLSESIVRASIKAGFPTALKRPTSIWRPVMVASFALHAVLVPCCAIRGANGMALIWFAVVLISLWPALSRSARLLCAMVVCAIAVALLFASNAAIERWFNAVADPYADGYMWHAFAKVLRRAAFSCGATFSELLLLVPGHGDYMVLAEAADVFGALGLSAIMLAALIGICWAAWSSYGISSERRAVAAGLLTTIVAPMLFNVCSAFHVIPFFAVSFPLLSAAPFAWTVAPFATALLVLMIRDALPACGVQSPRDELPSYVDARSQNSSPVSSDEC